jgi:hypothetical protein
VRLPVSAGIDQRMNKLLGLGVVVALCGCKKSSKPEPAPTPPTGSDASAPATAPVDAAAAAPVAVDAAAPASAAIKLDHVPDDWTRTDEADGGTLEGYAAVNESKYPVDNAQFTFQFGPSPDGAPADPAKFGEWFALEMKTKIEKTENLGDATYYVFAGPKGGDGDKLWHVVKKLGDKLYQCGGPMYAAGDYKHIPKERAAMVATAKKICASMKR